MSYADDFGHDIPPDDYPGGSGYKTSDYRYVSGDLESITLDFIKVHKETDKALLIEFEDGKVWLPKSRVRSFDKENLKIMIPRWLSENLRYIQD
jgi:hypothetical protein